MVRNEMKFEIKLEDKLKLSFVLSQILKHDDHGNQGHYHVRSVYFDDIYDRSLNQNRMGLAKRSKYRIRMYDFNTDYLLLERKSKNYHKGFKEHYRLQKEEVDLILKGDVSCLDKSKSKLALEFSRDVKINQLRAVLIVDYEREAFMHPCGNVRVTIDSKIRVSAHAQAFFNQNLSTVPKLRCTSLLEIKYDRYIPDFIQSSINGFNLQRIAHSKYVLGRMAS